MPCKFYDVGVLPYLLLAWYWQGPTISNFVDTEGHCLLASAVGRERPSMVVFDLSCSHAFVFLIEEHALQLLDILATDDALDLPDTTGLVFNVVVVVFVVVSGGGPRAKAARAFHTVGHVGARPGDTNGPVRLTNEACRLLSDSWLVMTDFCFGGALDKDVRRGRGIASSAGIGIFKASAKVGEGSVKVREGSAKGRQSSRRFRTRENRVILNDGHPVSIGGVVQLVDTNAVDERRRTAIGEVLVNRGVAAKASAVVALDAAVPPEAVIIVAGDNRVRAIRVIVVAGDNRIRSIHVIVVACHRAVLAVHFVAVSHNLKIGFTKGLVVSVDYHGVD